MLGQRGAVTAGVRFSSTGVLPAANAVQDLGSPTLRWGTLYLTATSLDLGGKTLSIVNGALEFSGIGGFTAPAAPVVPSCRLFTTSQQSIPSATWTTINWANESYDALDMHDPVINNTRITIPTGDGGKYLVTASLGFALNSTGNRGIRVRRNGVGQERRVLTD